VATPRTTTRALEAGGRTADGRVTDAVVGAALVGDALVAIVRADPLLLEHPVTTASRAIAPADKR
jgi:hypothetical protein